MDSRGEKLRIFEVIHAFEAYVQSCRDQRGRTSVIKIDADEIEQFLHELAICIPDDIRKANALQQDVDSILDAAKAEAESRREQADRYAQSATDAADMKAKEILNDARAERERLIDANSVTEESRRRAAQMIKDTESTCQDLFAHAQTEACILLKEAETVMRSCLKALRTEYDTIGVRETGTRYDRPVQVEPEEYEAQPDDEYTGTEVHDDTEAGAEDISRDEKSAPEKTDERKKFNIFRDILGSITGFYTEQQAEGGDSEESFDDPDTGFDSDTGVDD